MTKREDAKIMLATPLRASGNSQCAEVTVSYTSFAQYLMASGACYGSAGIGSDIVRSRSRLVSEALRIPGLTHVLWVDADTMVPRFDVIWDMLATGHDIIGCTYPKKEIHWDRVGRAWAAGERDPLVLEAAAYDYAFHIPPGRVEVPNGVMQVESIGMGFMLTSIAALRHVAAGFRELEFDDVRSDGTIPTSAMFMPRLYPRSPGSYKSVLLGEDYAFCSRARDLGIPVHLWVNDVLGHAGAHMYRGHHSGFLSPVAATTNAVAFAHMAAGENVLE